MTSYILNQQAPEVRGETQRHFAPSFTQLLSILVRQVCLCSRACSRQAALSE
jgi:hypothetical protein